jgi:hypothetical protein
MRRTVSAEGRPVLFGEAPWGYRVSTDRRALVVDDNEQAVTAVVRHMRSEGKTLMQIVAALRELGVANRRGQPFTLSRVHEMLSGAKGVGVAPRQSLDASVEPGPKSGSRITIRDIDVPGFARSYPLGELRLHPWTRRALVRAGFSVLGELHRKGAAVLCGLQGVNLAVIKELRALIDEIRTAGPRLPGRALDVLDGALRRLDARPREVLLLHLGGTRAGPLPLAEVARRLGIGTGEAARQHEVRAIAQLRVLAGPAFGQVLRDLEARAVGGEPLSGESVTAAWSSSERRPLSRPRIRFYGRLLERLAPGLARKRG